MDALLSLRPAPEYYVARCNLIFVAAALGLNPRPAGAQPPPSWHAYHHLAIVHGGCP